MRDDRVLVSMERLRKLLSYDPVTGLWTWQVRKSSRSAAGSVAGTLRKDGYIKIQIDGVDYFAHRLAFFYMTGRWPWPECDHRDTIRTHNWWSNLREATEIQNQGNQRLGKRNTSGFKGVTWAKNKKKWQAQIRLNGRSKFLGLFKDPREAHLAYCKSAEAHHGEFARAA